MTVLIDLNDVPLVQSDDLMRVMQRLIAQEDGLILLKGLNAQTHQALEEAIWKTFENQPEVRLAVLVRFEALIHLFKQRRFRDLFTLHGLGILTSVFAVASAQRLNTTWGFNQQAFLNTLRARQQQEQTAARHQPANPVYVSTLTSNDSRIAA